MENKMLEEELRLEDYFTTLAQEALQRSIDKNLANDSAAVTHVGQQLVKYGLDDALKAVEGWLETIKKPKRGVKPGYLEILKRIEEIYTEIDEETKQPYLRVQMIHVLTLVPFQFLVNTTVKGEKPLAMYVSSVASEIEDECKIEAFLKTIPEHIQKGLLNGIKDRSSSRRYMVYYAKQFMDKNSFEWTRFPKKDLFHLATELLEVVIRGSGYWYIEEPKTLREMPIVRPTEWLVKTWQQNTERVIGNAFHNCPMVIKPKPWESMRVGGYYGRLAGKHTLVRYGHGSGAFMQQYLRRMDETDLTDVMSAINTIQETPWRINKRVYEVLSEIIRLGGDMAGIPNLKPLPQLPDLPPGFTEDELKAHKKEKWRIYKADIVRETIAMRCLGHYRTAKAYLKYDRIYFPYNMDFRGRVYPIPSFSPQSDDVNKGLLEFADVPPCKSMDDIGWLMIHGADIAGVDKVSFEERKQWVLDNEEHILKSAQDPLGYRWWMNDDFDHFQMLAFCFEWQAWKQYEAEHGTPEGYLCHIPIAFDGTCSGLQHYSALLRDEIGGKAVNLIPGEKPSDIYRVVAEAVQELVEADLQTGTADEEKVYDEGTEKERWSMKLGTRTLAQQWQMYGISRKVTKRSVMTLAYGSKEYGFRDQILEDIILAAQRDGKGSMFIQPNQAAGYMAHKIWVAVQSIVVKAVEGMQYLQAYAREVCKSGRIITWTSPMGLPIQQHYLQMRTEMYKPRLSSGIRRHIYDQVSTGNVDKHSQVTGIAPNFIHSLDASHLQLTVLNSSKVGIKHFALIHDSFGCPASQAGTLFKTVRESFLQLYTDYDPLGAFTGHLEVYLQDNAKVPMRPRSGKLNLEKVLGSQYMFA